MTTLFKHVSATSPSCVRRNRGAEHVPLCANGDILRMLTPLAETMLSARRRTAGLRYGRVMERIAHRGAIAPRVALIAHDGCKDDMVEWATFNRGTLARCE